MIVEICANSVQSAINAQNGGAQRIELCQNLNEGGTTPSYAAIQYCAKNLKLKTFVLIRPRVGNFNYSDVEFEIIKNDVVQCKELGIAGVVVGFLNEDLAVDFEKTAEIVKLAAPMEVTFHRAIDICCDLKNGLEQIIKAGCHRVLTSGQKKSAFEGISVLKELVRQADGRIKILAGSGINAQNVKEIIEKTGVEEVHASCKKVVSQNIEYSEEQFLDRSNVFHSETDVEEVRRIMNYE